MILAEVQFEFFEKNDESVYEGCFRESRRPSQFPRTVLQTEEERLPERISDQIALLKQEPKRQKAEYKKASEVRSAVLSVQKNKKVQVGLFEKMTADLPPLIIPFEVQFELFEKLMREAMRIILENTEVRLSIRG